jgi:nucleotidyltransferase/DNA polymerase involved in DNA repair
VAEPTEEGKKLQEAVDAKLKELGYDDHAKKVIERVNAGEKAKREELEKAQGELKKYQDAEKKRKEDDDKVKADAEKERKRIEDEKKTFEERMQARVDELEQTFARKLTEAETAATKKQGEFLEELKKRDAEILMQSVRAAAAKRGILDEDLVAMLDVSKVPIENGKPSLSTIEELIETHATAKPHLYRSKEDMDRERDAGGRFIRANPAGKTGEIDASKLNPEEFSALTDKLRSGKT